MMNPAAFSVAMGELVLDGIAANNSIAALADRPGYPSVRVVARWRAENPEFDADVRATEKLRAAALVEEGLTIVDDATADKIEVVSANGRVHEKIDNEAIQRSKIRAEQRRWMASRLDRDRWGESQTIDVNAKVLAITLTEAELDRKLAETEARLGRIAAPALIEHAVATLAPLPPSRDETK